MQSWKASLGCYSELMKRNHGYGFVLHWISSCVEGFSDASWCSKSYKCKSTRGFCLHRGSSYYFMKVWEANSNCTIIHGVLVFCINCCMRWGWVAQLFSLRLSIKRILKCNYHLLWQSSNECFGSKLGIQWKEVDHSSEAWLFERDYLP